MKSLTTLFILNILFNVYTSKAAICSEPACILGDSKLIEVDPVNVLANQQISSMLLVDDLLPDLQTLLELQSELELNQHKYDKISNLGSHGVGAMPSEALMDILYHQGFFNVSKLASPNNVQVTTKPKK